MLKGLENFKKFLEKHDKFIITTHESPDGDALGSAVSFKEFLKNLGKTTLILNSDPTPDNFKFIDIDNEVIVIDQNYKLPADIEQYGHFVLDTNDYDNIGSVYFLLKDLINDRFIIDHHESDDILQDSNFIKVGISSVSEIIYELYEYYNMKLTFKSAQAIFAGMVFDTGSFRYPITSPQTLRIAAICIENGVVPFDVYEQIWEQNSLSGFELKSRILSTMEILQNGKMIAMKLTPEMVKETNASFAEGETSINLPLSVKGVVLSVLVKQNIDSPVKVSMRSKGDLNVADIAMHNGGGGHKNAAGFKSNMDFEKTYQFIIDALQRLF